MKKKTTIRDRRDQQQSQQREKHQQLEAERRTALEEKERAAEAEAQARMKAMRKAQAEKARAAEAKRQAHADVPDPAPSTERKSRAKAAGLKSTFVLSDRELLMTAFGSGNKAIREKRVENGEISDLADPLHFSAKAQPKGQFQIDGRVKGASVDDPLYHGEEQPRRGDLAGTRPALEQRFFGRTFEDNIHIQLIHNILDMDKVITLHINNIIYTVNNLLRTPGQNELVDIMGDMNISNTSLGSLNEEKAKRFRRLCAAKQLGYFNLEILRGKNEQGGQKSSGKTRQDPNTLKLTAEEFYDMLKILGGIRQQMAHGEGSKVYSEEGIRKSGTSVDTLSRLYAGRVKELNDGFLQKARTDLKLLFHAFRVRGAEQKKIWVRDYYDFVVRKEYKNQGFSIRLLREQISKNVPDAAVMRDEKYDTTRSKLNRLVDFAIFRYYRENEQRRMQLVDSLRASVCEADKTDVYWIEAHDVWPELRELVLWHILPEVSGDNVALLSKEKEPDPDVNETMLDGVRISEKATTFSKIIYLMTMFLDGKEINDLLTQLVHKFESIDAFLAVMKEEGLETAFTEGYRLFARSREVAGELRVINSFARMSKPAAYAREVMFREAVKVLGYRMSDEELDRTIAEMVDPNGKGTHMHGVRNFISRNVITSDRFHYIVRYGNVEKVRGLAGNRQIVSFVLGDVPDTQIVRYYNSVNGVEQEYRPAMRRELADFITGFRFDDLTDVRQSDAGANLEEQENKRRKQAAVRLYLTVLYLVLKNLVYVNARYFLAFSCVERDRRLADPEKWGGNIQEKTRTDSGYAYPAFARDFLEKHPPKKRVAEYLRQNFANSDDWAVRVYRNKIEHLDAIRNADMFTDEITHVDSWFSLYHYILQRRLMDQYAYDSADSWEGREKTPVITVDRINPRLFGYFEQVRKYHTASKDLIKALNVPFAYNLPRYKNLSIDGLFDRNRPGEAGGGRNPAMAAEE